MRSMNRSLEEFCRDDGAQQRARVGEAVPRDCCSPCRAMRGRHRVAARVQASGGSENGGGIEDTFRAPGSLVFAAA